MNINMNNREIHSVYWPDTESDQGRLIERCETRRIFFDATHHGDHDEFWIVVEDGGGNETQRWNPRYVEGWTWWREES